MHIMFLLPYRKVLEKRDIAILVHHLLEEKRANETQTHTYQLQEIVYAK